MVITVEGLILTGFVFECTYERAFITAISYVSDFALDLKSEYQSSHAGSELNIVYALVDFTVLESTS
jgi:hypothetical protein